MADKREYCAREGLIGGMGMPMMSEHQRPVTEEDLASGRQYACSNVRCAQCGCAVRYFDERMWSSGDGAPWVERQDEIEQQYDNGRFADNLATNTFSHKYRAYACRCQVRSQSAAAELVELRLDMDLPWHCDGHVPPFDET